MVIHQLPLTGAALVEVQPYSDHRGIFARFFCARELSDLIKDRQIVNVNYSRTSRVGAVRGMHYQRPPHQEMKLVRCIGGAVYDVLVDLRRGSSTFLQWHGEILSADNQHMLCIPEGFAHGFQVLQPESELMYLTTQFYVPGSEGGIRYDDPAVGVKWPCEVTEVSEKDLGHPLLHAGASPLEAV